MVARAGPCLAQVASPPVYQGFDRIIPPVTTGPPYVGPLPTLPPGPQHYVRPRHGRGAQLVPTPGNLLYDPFALPAPDTPPIYGGYTYGVPGVSALPGQAAPPPVPSANYYLHDGTEAFAEHPDLARAVRDIERAFRTGDTALLRAHLPLRGAIGLRNLDGTTRRVPAEMYLSATETAIRSMRTVGYTLNGVEPTGHGAWRVVGVHAIRAADGSTRTYAVGFVLHRVRGQWLISEVAGQLLSVR